MGIPFIDGERLYLRALEDADADGPHVAWFNDDEVCLGNSHHVFPYTREAALSYIRSAQQTRDELILAIVLRDGDCHIGNIALQQFYCRPEAMISGEVDDFVVWLRSRGTIPTVVALRRGFEAVRQSELERLAPKLNGLPPAARARVDEVTRLIVHKLLLAPTERLKSVADEATASQYAEAITQLFNLDDPMSETPDDCVASASASETSKTPVTS